MERFNTRKTCFFLSIDTGADHKSVTKRNRVTSDVSHLIGAVFLS